MCMLGLPTIPMYTGWRLPCHGTGCQPIWAWAWEVHGPSYGGCHLSPTVTAVDRNFMKSDSNNSFALFEYTVPLTLGPWACSECLNSLIWSDSSWLKGFEWRASYVSFLSFQFLLTISLRIFRFTHLLLWAQQPQPLLQFALLVLWASLKSFLPLDTKGLGYQNINSGPSHISSVWSYY